ncbi:hypothetical protein IT398_00270 [Candidatus Nomurabacteria bacterium]|nr:hypothetical protein [Candidatus Nomurabacteria bacterium]
MVTVIEVTREGNESNSSVMRRFSKRVQTSGVIRRVKSLKAAERPQSHYKRKKSALKRLKRRTEYERLKKLGKN